MASEPEILASRFGDAALVGPARPPTDLVHHGVSGLYRRPQMPNYAKQRQFSEESRLPILPPQGQACCATGHKRDGRGSRAKQSQFPAGPEWRYRLERKGVMTVSSDLAVVKTKPILPEGETTCPGFPGTSMLRSRHEQGRTKEAIVRNKANFRRACGKPWGSSPDPRPSGLWPCRGRLYKQSQLAGGWDGPAWETNPILERPRRRLNRVQKTS
jgi:hypothetical protein